MVRMKRKINDEKDRYGSFDTIIEVDEVGAKSYKANQHEAAETMNYSTRRQTVNSATVDTARNINTGANRSASTAVKKKSGEIMPQIKKEQQKHVAETIGLKTKMLLITYVAVAMILAAVVIGTGVAIANATRKAGTLQDAYEFQTQIVADQVAHLAVLTDEDAITGRAVNRLDMEKVTTYAEISLVDVYEPVAYTPNTSVFDSISRFIASIFN